MVQDDPVPPTGVEPQDVSIRLTRTLRQSSQERAAKSDALDPNLQELIGAWPDLSQAVRGAILVMVRAAVSK
jgi:hypothetical protein